MKYIYNLNVKKILTHFILALPLIFFMFYLIFIADENDKKQIEKTELKYAIKYKALPYSIYIAGVYCLIVDIYFLELLLYKRKNVLSIEENKITFFAPEYKKIEFYKSDIQNITLTTNNFIKITTKHNIKKSIRATIWSNLKALTNGHNPKNVFTINLKYLNCYAEDLRYPLIKYEYYKNSQKANLIINKIMQENNIKTINELKQNNEIFESCILQLYKIDDFSQANIAAILETNTNKISKIIRKH